MIQRDYGAELAAALSSTGMAASASASPCSTDDPAIGLAPTPSKGTQVPRSGFSQAGLVACARLVAERRAGYPAVSRFVG